MYCYTIFKGEVHFWKLNCLMYRRQPSKDQKSQIMTIAVPTIQNI